MPQISANRGWLGKGYTPYLSHQCLRCLPPLLKIPIFHFQCWHSVAVYLTVTYLCSGVLQSDIARQLQNHCWICNVVCKTSCLHLLYSHTLYLQCSESVQKCFLLAFKIHSVPAKSKPKCEIWYRVCRINLPQSVSVASNHCLYATLWNLDLILCENMFLSYLLQNRSILIKI